MPQSLSRSRMPCREFLSEPALEIWRRSLERWGPDRAVAIVGQSRRLVEALERAAKIARFQEPVLILGESGSGKESLASAVHILGPRFERPFVTVSCPQFQEGNLTVSELFGHRRGSFTGATSDRAGCFETANGGTIFLDEVGDLHVTAQSMLLRALATGEFYPLGSDQPRRVNVRTLSATNRDLNALAGDERFRRDLLFRLRYFQLELPPLRERGNDWYLLAEYFLDRLAERYGVQKQLSSSCRSLLERYPWPGNVRELLAVVTSGYALSEGSSIEVEDLMERLEGGSGQSESEVERLYRQLCRESGDFWHLVQEPFLDRELSRREVRWLVARGLREARGSYRRLLELWRLPLEQYQKFMDFLRHHRLKPARPDEER